MPKAIPSLALAAFAVLATGCSDSTDRPSDVIIASASDLRFALEELSAAFAERHPEWRPRISYGSSGVYYTQLRNGAPFDLYLSADVDYPRRLEEEGLTWENSLFTYAVGRIVLWTPKGSAIDVAALGAEAFTDSRLEKLAIANPLHAPYGQAAESSLRSLGVYDAIADRIVLGENVAQALQFVQSGAADAGVVALALALAPEVRGEGAYWEIPLDAYPPMEQGGVVMKAAANREGALAFRDFMLSAEGREMLKSYGFFPPE